MIDVGQRVGNYDITATLGEGGMGTVFLAEHPVIGSKVALKAIHPQFARDAEIVSRFMNEAKAVNQIGHDHIVDISDFGTTPTGDFYFMMEYLEGEGLSDAIGTGAPFPPARALNIAAQIADALAASHEHGVIHRDLKPDNIFLIVRDGADDFVKVLDFGLAKLTHTDELATHHSRTGSVMGTPYYMSPEQCEGKTEIDHRSDIYSLGVILFEMLTGKIPFGGEGYGEILIKHVTVRPPAASSLVADLPPSMDLILSRALAKNPGHRFATMATFRAALLDPERFASSEPTAEIHEDLTGRVRAAKPMARTELNLPSLPAQRLAGAGPAPSTFRDNVGEVWVRQDERRPKRHGGRNAVLASVLLAGVVVGALKYGHQARRFVAEAAAPANPATVRVNFNSDPDGAAVVRSDGVVLGATPLSTEVPFGNAAIEYVIRLDGYLPKPASIVPNMPSPVFAVLERDDPGLALDRAPPEADSTGEAPAIAVAPISAWRLAVGHRARRHPQLRAPLRLEATGDNVLDPSFR
jgi:tRNA A-37 threonylcarbamoyl transferase component Bud32